MDYVMKTNQLLGAKYGEIRVSTAMGKTDISSMSAGIHPTIKYIQ